MPRFEKGSKDAIEWAAKMKKAREAKKVSGGMINDTPFGMPVGGKKLSLKRDNDKTPSPPSKVLKKESPAAEYPDIDFMPIAPDRNPILTKATKPIAKTATKGSLKLTKGKGMKGGAIKTEDEIERFINSFSNYPDQAVRYMIGEIYNLLGFFDDDSVKEEIDIFIDEIKSRVGLNRQQPNMSNKISGGYLQPGEVPLSSTNEALIASKEIEAPVEMSAEKFITDEEMDGTGMCGCRRCSMCGGKMNLRKGLTKVGKVLGKVGDTLNPMSYALKNKTIRDAMIASGDVTQNYALPAVTTAGLPLYYGAAGTAGMMLGGPLGSMAATKAADELYKGMVVKPGYDPQQRQKSKTLGVVSKEVGKLGASQLKAGMSAPKNGSVAQAGKGMRKSKKKKLIIIEA